MNLASVKFLYTSNFSKLYSKYRKYEDKFNIYSSISFMKNLLAI